MSHSEHLLDVIVHTYNTIWSLLPEAKKKKKKKELQIFHKERRIVLK
jgi:hypothetical protein